jgi:hypothetical protein
MEGAGRGRGRGRGRGSIFFGKLVCVSMATVKITISKDDLVR